MNGTLKLFRRTSPLEVATQELYDAPSIAHDNQSPVWKRTVYRVGDGDYFAQPARPGSDHRHIKSKGFPT